MLNEKNTPELSVIVTVVDGAKGVERCLEALRKQSDPPQMEIIVPIDDTVNHIAALGSQFPEVEFLSLGSLGKDPRNGLEEHDFIDKRRTAGLEAATAPLIAIVEDRGPPAKNWARALTTLHAENSHAAIGGGVVNCASNALLSAAFKIDFARSEPPAPTSERRYLTDVNICFKREALMAVRDVWEGKFAEVPVNDALRANGGKLLYSSIPLVEQTREPRPIHALLSERFHWGRNYAQIRATSLKRTQCIFYALGTPILPFLLISRIYQLDRAKGRSFLSFLALAPILFLLLIFWSFGELMGYIDGALDNAQWGTP